MNAKLPPVPSTPEISPAKEKRITFQEVKKYCSCQTDRWTLYVFHSALRYTFVSKKTLNVNSTI